jgi:hypothetical protein
MKLRFRENSLRLRLNQVETRALAAGETLSEHVQFPGNSKLAYTLIAREQSVADTTFRNNLIAIAIPRQFVQRWAESEEVGMYFDLPAGAGVLRVAVEKDLECVEGPEEERDPDAFPRLKSAC